MRIQVYQWKGRWKT